MFSAPEEWGQPSTAHNVGPLHSCAPGMTKQGSNGRTALTAHLPSKALLICLKEFPFSHSSEITGIAVALQGPTAEPEWPFLKSQNCQLQFFLKLQKHLSSLLFKYPYAGVQKNSAWSLRGFQGSLASQCSINMMGWVCLSTQRAVPGHTVDALLPICHLFTLHRFGKSTLDTTTPHCPGCHTSTTRAEHTVGSAEAVAAAVLHLLYRTVSWLSSQKG